MAKKTRKPAKSKSQSKAKKRKATKPKKAARKPKRLAIKNRLTELLDRRLLNLATKQYARILREVAKGRKRIDDEKKLALQLGERIVAKAREVKATLTSK